MADTSYLRREVESHVRAQLAVQHDQSFSSQFLTLRTGGRHEFDAVSADGQIVAGVKAASGLTAGGRIPSGKINSSLAELYYLSLVEAPIRLLILTNPEFHEIFLKKTSGAIADGITVVCMPLPEAMQAEVDAVVRRASDEVSPTVVEKIVASEVEDATSELLDD
jgi:hypothetical protein